MTSFACENLRRKINEQTKQTKTQIQKTLGWLPEESGFREIGEKREGIKMHKLPVIKTFITMQSTAWKIQSIIILIMIYGVRWVLGLSG